MPRLARRALRILACLLSLTFAAGCGDACLTLADQICVCLPDDGTRAACSKRARDQEASYPVRSEDTTYCQQQIDSHACDCNNLNTDQGRQNCGIAYKIAQP
jgi:hypothetical protein